MYFSLYLHHQFVAHDVFGLGRGSAGVSEVLHSAAYSVVRLSMLHSTAAKAEVRPQHLLKSMAATTRCLMVAGVAMLCRQHLLCEKQHIME